MYRLRQDSEAAPMLHIQSLACCPHSVSPRSKSPPFPRSPPRQTPSPTKALKTIIRASLPELIMQHEKLPTADANIATMPSCGFAFPRPLLSVCNLDSEAYLSQISPTSGSPEGKNCFPASGQRSKSTQKLCFRRVRRDKFASLDLKSPSVKPQQASDIHLNRRVLLPTVLKGTKYQKMTWLAEPLSGQMAGYSLLKRQRLKHKAEKRSARTPHSPALPQYGDLDV